MTVGSDISWSGPGETFNLRVAAVITRGEKILLCTVEGLGYWFLPGGRVRFGEPGGAALARELAEELGHQLPAGELALIVENIYRDNALQHEVGLYYHLAWPDTLASDDLDGGVEPGHLFCWTPVGELGSVNPATFPPMRRPIGHAPCVLYGAFRAHRSLAALTENWEPSWEPTPTIIRPWQATSSHGSLPADGRPGHVHLLPASRDLRIRIPAVIDA